MTQQQVFTLKTPKSSLPLIFDSPHSGRVYPDDFRFSCPYNMLERAEDNQVDDLFSSVPHYGGTLLYALFPRTYIDVNRASDDIDSELLAVPWPHAANPSKRSHAGIGLIRRVLKPGVPVYSRSLHPNEILYRIENYYEPYHEQLEKLIEEHHYNYGQCWHINCHSMPGTTNENHAIPFGTSPDFVLGDRDGTTCALDFTHNLRNYLKSLGYRVAINTPYRGVELVRRYSSPVTGRHSLQIEINKALYWNEVDNKPSKNYAALKDDIEKLIRHTAAYAAANLSSMAAD